MARKHGIVVASDLSARSRLALERAVHLAREMRSTLTAVHVVDAELPREVGNRLRSDGERILYRQLAAMPAAAGVKIRIAAVLGRAAEDILGIAENVKAGLIVLGAHRPHPAADLFRGTTAERVLRGGHRPVLLVRRRARGPYRKVMVGMDFSLCSRRALETALRLAPRGEFHAVHAWEVPFPAFLSGRGTRREVMSGHQAEMRRTVEQELAALRRTHGARLPRLHPVLRRGEVCEVLAREVRRLRPDLLAIGTHGRTGAARAILGSVAEELLTAPPCDVLAVKAW